MDQEEFHSEFNGEKWVVKPMDLSRINLNDMKVTTDLLHRSIQISEYQSVYSVPVLVPTPNTSITPHLTREEAKLQIIQSIKDKTEALKDLIPIMKQNKNESLQNQTNMFSEFREELYKQLNYTREKDKMKILKLSKNMNQHLNEVSSQINSYAENPPWPSRTNLCIWAPISAASCPDFYEEYKVRLQTKASGRAIVEKTIKENHLQIFTNGGQVIIEVRTCCRKG